MTTYHSEGVNLLDNSKKEFLNFEQKVRKMFMETQGITAEEFIEHEIVLKNTIAYQICVCHLSLIEFTNKIYEWFKEKVIELYQFEEERPVPKRNLHKIDFTRRKMQHQVIECKPRHLIKKIIR